MFPQATLPVIPPKGTAFFTVLNYATCPITVTSLNGTMTLNISGNDVHTVTFLQSGSFYFCLAQISGKETVKLAGSSSAIYDCLVNGSCLISNTFLTANLTNEKSTYAIVTDTHLGWVTTTSINDAHLNKGCLLLFEGLC